MKLKNRNTSVIGDLVAYDADKGIFAVKAQGGDRYYYYSLAALYEVWEDAPEESKEYWAIDCFSPDGELISQFGECSEKIIKNRKQIGNYFLSKEEAEKAVRNLKAWKRLRGGGFEFMSCSYGHDKTTDDTGGWIRFRVNHLYDERYGCEVEKDLNTCFGGEE